MYKEHGGGAAAPAHLAGIPGAGVAAVVLGQGVGTAGQPVPAVARGAGHPEQCLSLGSLSNTDISCDNLEMPQKKQNVHCFVSLFCHSIRNEERTKKSVKSAAPLAATFVGAVVQVHTAGVGYGVTPGLKHFNTTR